MSPVKKLSRNAYVRATVIIVSASALLYAAGAPMGSKR